MLAEQVMISDPHTAHIDELIESVLVCMSSAVSMYDALQIIKQDKGNNA